MSAPFASRSKFILIFAVIALAIGAWWLWPSDASKTASTGTGGLAGPGAMGRPFGPSNLPTPVRVGEVTQGRFAIELKALGTATASETVQVRSRVAGELKAIHFREGQKVNKGDLLAVIDPAPYQVALQKAKGALAQTKAQLKNAENDLARYELLLKQDSIAEQTVQNQAASVTQLKGTLLSQEAEVRAAELDLSYTQIKAPISGRLGLRQMDVGNLVAANDATPLVTITQVEPIDVAFTLPEAQLGQVLKAMRKDQALTVKAYDRGESELLATGTLYTLDNQIDLSTGTVKLKARFNNPESLLFPNQFVNVRLVVETLENAVLLPSSALQYGSKGTFVYVVRDNKVELKPVTAGSGNTEITWIKEGVSAGDKVVLEGTDRLREGSAVEVIEAGE